jgi:hypothetical protein
MRYRITRLSISNEENYTDFWWYMVSFLPLVIHANLNYRYECVTSSSLVIVSDMVSFVFGQPAHIISRRNRLILNRRINLKSLAINEIIVNHLKSLLLDVYHSQDFQWFRLASVISSEFTIWNQFVHWNSKS